MTVAQKIDKLQTKYRVIELIGTICIVLAAIVGMYILQPMHYVTVLNAAAITFIVFTSWCIYSYREEMDRIVRSS